MDILKNSRLYDHNPSVNRIFHTHELKALSESEVESFYTTIFSSYGIDISPSALEDMTYLSMEALRNENKLVKEYVIDYQNHPAKERAEFIRKYLPRVRDLVSGEMFSKLRMDAMCDNAPEVRAEMVRHGYVEEMKADPSPVVQEALKEYLKEHPYMTQVAYDKEPVFKMHKSKETEPGR